MKGVFGDCQFTCFPDCQLALPPDSAKNHKKTPVNDRRFFVRSFCGEDSAATEQRQRFVSGGLIGHREILETFQRFVRIFICTQGKGVETAAAHVK